MPRISGAAQEGKEIVKSGTKQLKFKAVPLSTENRAKQEMQQLGMCGRKLWGSSSSWGIHVARELRTKYHIQGNNSKPKKEASHFC